MASAKPYREWIERIRIKLDDLPEPKERRAAAGEPLLDRQQAFAYTQEDIKFILTPMATNGEEPIGSMGNDSPLAVLSNKNKTLYHYFKQLFAQVTNPADRSDPRGAGDERWCPSSGPSPICSASTR